MQYPLIDVLRGFAALSVLVYHLIPHWEWDAFPASGPLAWFRNGWMAVDLFFVISGFVIGLSAFSRLQAEGAGFRRGFLRSRLARIVPLHFLALAVFVAAVQPGLWRQDDFWANLGTHLLFVHNLFPDYHGAINGPNWSLGTEMQFYLLVALAAPWLATARPWRILAAFVAIAWAWRWGAWALTIPGPFEHAYYAQTQLPGMLDAFAIGLVLARFVRTSAGESVLQRLARDWRPRYALVAAVALCWWALLEVFHARHFWHEPAMAVFFRTGLAACGGLALLLACAWPLPKGGWLRAPLYLGKVSYGIYLWHLPVLILLHRHAGLEPLPALLAAMAATLALASLTWHAFEQPLLWRWGRASSPGCSRPKSRTPPAPPRPRPHARGSATRAVPASPSGSAG